MTVALGDIILPLKCFSSPNIFDFDRMMVMRYDSLDKMSGVVDYDAHIDQLDEPPTCQRMGIMASFNSMEEFEM